MSRRIVLFIMTLAFAVTLFPTSAFAADKHDVVRKKWGAEVRRQLKRHHLWTKKRENQIINIITHESGGNSKARNGSCVGLLQFNNGWKHNYSNSYYKKHSIKGRNLADDRLSGYWSIHRIVHVYRDGGDKYVARHWAATINR